MGSNPTSTALLSACQLAAAAVMLGIALGISGARPPQLTAECIAAVAVLGITGTGLAYVLNYQIIASEGAPVASTVTYLVPAIAVILGVLVLTETITVNMIAGIAWTDGLCGQGTSAITCLPQGAPLSQADTPGTTHITRLRRYMDRYGPCLPAPGRGLRL